MICLTCREAADDQRAADQHCGSTGGPGAACTCQHRTDRYQGRDGHEPDDTITIPYVTTED